ncbi:hypothetical protein GCM10022207_00140 [Streptomyces lannensis]|uniref:Uncharacterized protein n=1 Tax=Streptomyces lannensis TaxID=766498 RepID=A0ABP7JGH3_9ACTN
MRVDDEISEFHVEVTPMSRAIAVPARADATEAKTNPSMNIPPPVATVRRRRKRLVRWLVTAMSPGSCAVVVTGVPSRSSFCPCPAFDDEFL